MITVYPVDSAAQINQATFSLKRQRGYADLPRKRTTGFNGKRVVTLDAFDSPSHRRNQNVIRKTVSVASLRKSLSEKNLKTTLTKTVIPTKIKNEYKTLKSSSSSPNSFLRLTLINNTRVSSQDKISHKISLKAPPIATICCTESTKTLSTPVINTNSIRILRHALSFSITGSRSDTDFLPSNRPSKPSAKNIFDNVYHTPAITISSPSTVNSVCTPTNYVSFPSLPREDSIETDIVHSKVIPCEPV